MTKQTNKFYVTTPIYYVNAKPHLGSLYSTLLADAAARWHHLMGQSTFLLTGTDEHGQKVAQAAQKAGKEPQQFVDSFIDVFKNTWRNYHINFNKFIRTTDKHHVKAIQDWLLLLIRKGEIYKSHYTGWYCTSCETFLTEKDAEEKLNGVPICPTCGRDTHKISEESYFFKLSAYQDKLLDFYEKNPDFITPRERAHEVTNFVREGLKDLSISRTTVKWGIPFPNDEHHVTYVWADALNNYITAIGYPDNLKELNQWWPADLQVMGKDIVRFHAVYWPAFLMATGLALPRQLLVHGWIKVGEQKMSKSLGNVVDPEDLLAIYGPEPIRYYLVRYMAINQDSQFSREDLENKINADLANDLGNLLNRMTTLALKYNKTTVSAPKKWAEAETKLYSQLVETIFDVEREMTEYYFHRAYARLWKFVSDVNSYFHAQEPWKLAQKDLLKFEEIISAAAHSLYAIAVLLLPIMPKKMEEFLGSLGQKIPTGNILAALKTEPWDKQFTLNQIPVLFQKFEPVKEPEKSMQTKPDQKPADISTAITIEDFLKVELVVGTIESVDEVPKSEKLYKLQVNFGDKGVRQVCSGVRQYFKPEELLHKQAVFVYNLQPRTIMGLESQGMLLIAKDHEGKAQLTTVAKPVPNGTKLQ